MPTTVPSTKERLAFIEARLPLIEEALNLKPPKPKSAFAQFRAHMWTQVKTHKGTIIPLTALAVAVIGWFATNAIKYYIDHKDDGTVRVADAEINKQVSPTLNRVDHNVTELEATVKTLQPFIEDLVRRQLEGAAALPVSQLREHLPAVQHLVSVATDQNVRIDSETITQISQKVLSIDPRSTDFWRVSADLVTYKSLNSDTRYLLTANLPNCTDQNPTPLSMGSYEAKQDGATIHHHALVNLPTYENCVVTLDSSSDDAKINNLLTSITPRLVFKHCRVIYRGGAINLILEENATFRMPVPDEPAPVELPAGKWKTLVFQDCAFDFQLGQTPPEQGQQITTAFLGQSGNILIFPDKATSK